MEENRKTLEDKQEMGHKYHHIKHPGMKIVAMAVALIVFILIVGLAFAAGRASSKVGRGNFSKVSALRNLEFGGRGEMASSRMMGGKENAGFRVAGDVTKIDGNNITIKDSSGNEISIVVSQSTSFRKNATVAKQSDLQVGNNITVVGPSDSNGVVQATAIIIR